MQAESINIKLLQGGNAEIVITTSDRSSLNHLGMLAGTCDCFDVEIKKHREKRSLTANSYLWTLCNKIAVELKSTKEEVYQEAIKRVGVFDHMAIQNEAVESFISRWSSQSIGNIAEVTGKAKSDDYKVVRVYYGSSVYDSKEMSRLIEYIVDEAKELNIETLTPDELAKLTAHGG